MAAAGNVPLWRELDALGLLQAHGGWLLALSLTGMVAAVLFAILSLLTWRPLLKPAIGVLLLATALGGYFMWTYHIVIDSSMATNTLQTDWHEALALFTPWLALTVLMGAVLPAWLVWRAPVRHHPWKKQALRNTGGVVVGIGLTVVLVLASFQPLASTMRNHKKLRYLLNPLNSIYAVTEVTVGGISTAELSTLTMEAKKLPGLFVIGEAVDVTGWLGGYNFQWASASGVAAGEAV